MSGRTPKGRIDATVVALGGGHGLAVTLRALAEVVGEPVGVVSMADDGGSSGRLRAALGVAPPGDVRKCLVALAEPGSLWARAFEHRFGAGELADHALGNLVLAGLAEVTGSLEQAIGEAGRLLGCAGRVLPATVGPVELSARVAGGRVEGQAAVALTRAIHALELRPPDPEVPASVLDAIARADLVLLGPGSLYTSVLAVAAVPRIRAALRQAAAPKVWVANLAAQVGETEGYDVAAHFDALRRHEVPVDGVVVDPAGLPLGTLPAGLDVMRRTLAARDGRAHDPALLGCWVAELLEASLGSGMERLAETGEHARESLAGLLGRVSGPARGGSAARGAPEGARGEEDGS